MAISMSGARSWTGVSRSSRPSSSSLRMPSPTMLLLIEPTRKSVPAVTGARAVAWVEADDRFEIVAPHPLNLICLRVAGDDDAPTDGLIERINADTDRDFVMEADAALEYGIIDRVISSREAVDRTGPIR